MNEAETLADHIDPALKAAGWGGVEGSRVLREHGIARGHLHGGGKRVKAEIADYVLVYRNSKLALIEAKAWDKPYTEEVGQAKSYAAKLAVRFTYATIRTRVAWRAGNGFLDRVLIHSAFMGALEFDSNRK